MSLHAFVLLCFPGGNEKAEDLGEVLNGDRMVLSAYDLSFRVSREKETLCKKTLSSQEASKFREAVKNDYYFQMYYDDLPIWGFIGKADQEPGAEGEVKAQGTFKYFLFTHIHFEIFFKGELRPLLLKKSAPP